MGYHEIRLLEDITLRRVPTGSPAITSRLCHELTRLHRANYVFDHRPREAIVDAVIAETHDAMLRQRDPEAVIVSWTGAFGVPKAAVAGVLDLIPRMRRDFNLSTTVALLAIVADSNKRTRVIEEKLVQVEAQNREIVGHSREINEQNREINEQNREIAEKLARVEAQLEEERAARIRTAARSEEQHAAVIEKQELILKVQGDIRETLVVSADPHEQAAIHALNHLFIYKHAAKLLCDDIDDIVTRYNEANASGPLVHYTTGKARSKLLRQLKYEPVKLGLKRAWLHMAIRVHE
jgi:hypothetical protein